VNTVCNLTSNPMACVLTVSARLERVGPAFVLPSKFVPGTANLVVASAGLGYVLAAKVTSVVNWVAGIMGTTAAVAAVLVLGALSWRHVRSGMHREAHRQEKGARRGGGLRTLSS